MLTDNVGPHSEQGRDSPEGDQGLQGGGAGYSLRVLRRRRKRTMRTRMRRSCAHWTCACA